jgi:hypothetical protein
MQVPHRSVALPSKRLGDFFFMDVEARRKCPAKFLRCGLQNDSTHVISVEVEAIRS